MRWIILSLFLFVCGRGNGQGVQSDFNLPSDACIDESFRLINQSTNAERFEWDLCQGDLGLTPVGKSVLSVPGSITAAIDVVFDGLFWFGFVTSREDNSIKRLDFGEDINSTPSIVDLGNVGGISPWRPIDIEVIYDNGEWFGFVYGESSNIITRIDFGSSLSNSASISAEVILTGEGNGNCGLNVAKNGSGYVIAYTNTYSFGTILLNTVRSIPAIAGTMHTGNIPGILNFGDVKLIYHTTNWYAYLPAYGSQKLFLAKLGSNPLTIPSFIDVSGNFIGVNSPFGIDIGVDKNEFIVFLSTSEGPLIRINLGKDLDASPVSGGSLGNLGVLANTLKFKLNKYQSMWTAFSISWNGGDVLRLDYPSPSCVEYPQVLVTENPQLNFQISGNKFISLRAYKGVSVYESNKSLFIKPTSAPSISISSNDICLQSPIQFSFDSNQSLIATDWLFGDTQRSTLPNPSHQYSSVGEYTVQLSVEATNGCKNLAEKIIKIYNSPISSFDLPVGIVCTNNEFTFTNNTVDTFDGNLTDQWFVDNNPETTTRDLKYSFLSSGKKDIKLKTSIPGCSSELTQTLLNVQTGPSVGFDFIGKCENEVIRFNNSSIGDISGYLWDFGNGKTSTKVNEIQTYSSNGTYLVSLQTTGTNGCVSSTTKPLTIYTTPQPDFSLDLPPFSCSGTPSQFNDLTPSPTDSNLSSWSWSFGDSGNGTASTKNPTYTYGLGGSYNVSLTTTTNFGCAATKLKTIQIAESPKPDFTLGASCLGKPTLFADASGANNKSWLWKIGGTSYAIKNPTHVFSAPGNFTGELMVTGNNNCVSVLSKPIIVYAPPTLDFLTANNCSPQATLFKDVTALNQDPAISRLWDFAGKGNGTGSSTQFAFPSPGTYNVKLTTSTQSGCIYSLTKSTIIVAAPIADFSSSDDSGPPPLAIQFKNQSKNAMSYQWRFNDPNSSSSSLESPSFTYTTLGDFRVDLTASNVLGCVDTKSEKIHVIVPSSEVELEQFTLLLDQVTGSVRPVLSIRNNSNYTIKNLEVILDIAGNALVKEKISLTVLPNASASQILKYELLPRNTKLDYLCVKLQFSDDRLSDETDLTDNSECISIESNEILFSPYPNPVTDQLNFDWIAEAPGSVKVSVVTQMGQLAYQKDISGVEVGLNQIVLDVSNLNSGFYMLIFESAGSRKTFPFVIPN
jgi:PKD repeat protein